MKPLPLNGTRSKCEVCGEPIYAAGAKWLHADPDYDPFAPPIHAPRPVDFGAKP